MPKTAPRAAAKPAPAAPGRMIVTVDTSALRAPLQAAAAVASRRETIPILSGVRLEAKNGTLTLTGHNLATGTEQTVPAEVAAEGALVIPARQLSDLVRRLDGPLTIAQEETTARLTWTSGEAEVGTLSADEFPLPSFCETPYELPSITFREAADGVAWAAGFDPGQPVLEGVRMRLSKDGIDYLATDRSKVGWLRTPLDEPPPLDEPIVVVAPAEVIAAVAKLASSSDRVRVGWATNGVTFAWGTSRYYSRILDGTYPEVDRMIPDEYPTTAVVGRASLLSAIRRILAVVADASPQTKVEVAQGTITVSSASAGSTARETLEAQIAGPDVSIAFNGRLLEAALDHAETDDVTLGLRGPEDLMRIRFSPDQFAIVLPMMPG